MSTTEDLDAYNLGLASIGWPPARHYGEDPDDFDVVFVEHEECARFMRAAEIPTYAMSEPWQDTIEGQKARVLLVDKCYRIAGDIHKHFAPKEVLQCRTPLPYEFPSEFLKARMQVSGLTVDDKAEIRELWRVATRAIVGVRIMDSDNIDPTGHPDAKPKPKATKVVDWLDVVAAPSPEWLIDNLIAMDSLTMLAAASTAGKSLLTLDWCLRMVHGMDWHGRVIRPGSVLYLCGEGAAGIGGRIRGWQAHHSEQAPLSKHYLGFSQGIPTLSTPTGLVDLGLMIEGTAKKHGHAPALVVVDTLSQAFGEGDENDSSTVAPAIRALTDLRQKWKCAILVLHHITKSSTTLTLNSVRGSGAFTANVDAVLGISQQDDIRTLRTLKLKDGEMAPPISFEVVGWKTGRVLPDGSVESAPVIVPAKSMEPVDKISDAERRIRAALSMVKTEGMTRRMLASYTGLGETMVFEACARMEDEGTLLKSHGPTPRYHLPEHAPKGKL